MEEPSVNLLDWEIAEIPKKIETYWRDDSIEAHYQKDMLIEFIKSYTNQGNRIESLKSDLSDANDEIDENEGVISALEDKIYELRDSLEENASIKKKLLAWIETGMDEKFLTPTLFGGQYQQGYIQALADLKKEFFGEEKDKIL